MKIRAAGDHEFAVWQSRAESGEQSLAAFGAGENERRDETALCTMDDTWAIADGLVVEQDGGDPLMYCVWDLEWEEVPVIRLVLEDVALAEDDALMLGALGMVFDELEDQFGDVAAWISQEAKRAHRIVATLGMSLTDRENQLSPYEWWTRSGKIHA